MSKQRTLDQIQKTPTIVGMMTITPADGMGITSGGRSEVDVVTFADGLVLVIGRDGIELWPSMDSLLNSDPRGDFAEMWGFIEYEEGPTVLTGVSWPESTRFGQSLGRGPCGTHIRLFEDGRLYLRDGCYLTLEPGSISLWDAGADEALGGITWEAL